MFYRVVVLLEHIEGFLVMAKCRETILIGNIAPPGEVCLIEWFV